MKIEFPGGAIRKYQRYVSGRGEAAATIYFEVAPDPDDRILAAKWKRLPDRSKHIITRRAALVVVPKALAAFELEVNWMKWWEGIWEKQTLAYRFD